MTHWKNRHLRNVFISRLKVYTKGNFRTAKGNCELTHTTLEWLSGWHRQMIVVPMRFHCRHPLCLKCQLQLHAKTTHQKNHPISTLQAFENRYSACFAADENLKKKLGCSLQFMMLCFSQKEVNSLGWTYSQNLHIWWEKGIHCSQNHCKKFPNTRNLMWLTTRGVNKRITCNVMVCTCTR